jgi:hypothetical protein
MSWVEVTYLVLHFVDLFGPLILKHLVILALLVLNYPLTFNLHVDELPFVLIHLVPQSLFPVVLTFLVSYSSVKQPFFLLDHDSFDSHCSLLAL